MGSGAGLAGRTKAEGVYFSVLGCKGRDGKFVLRQITVCIKMGRYLNRQYKRTKLRS